MHVLFETSNKLIRNVSQEFKRFIYERIDWQGRLTEIFGARGVGKTTLMLQKAGSLNLIVPGQAIYLSLDDTYFYEHSIIETADEFSKIGGKYLFLDEVHRYPEKFHGHDWSAELKNIYDKYPELCVIYSGSSLLQLFKGQGDLSRRRIAYHLPGLSFREFLEFNKIAQFPILTIDQLRLNHLEAAGAIIEKVKVFKWFETYLQFGYYPFYIESPDHYISRLKTIISVIIETDIPSVTDIPFDTSVKLKKLLAVIAGSVPFTPNLTKTGTDLHISDQRTLLKYLNYLDKAELITLLTQEAKGNQLLRKPDKIYINNTNLLNCFSVKPEVGTVRETFFLNQTSVDNVLTLPSNGDFMLNQQWIFEVGGKNKANNQIKGLENSYLALDSIETGYGNVIPLWVFGFLY